MRLDILWEVISTGLAIIFASGYYAFRRDDALAYNLKLSELKNDIKNISNKAAGCCVTGLSDLNLMVSYTELSNMVYHLQSDCLQMGKKYKHFHWNAMLRQALINYKKIVTGAGDMDVTERARRLKKDSVDLCEMIDNYYIKNPLGYALQTVSKI